MIDFFHSWSRLAIWCWLTQTWGLLDDRVQFSFYLGVFFCEWNGGVFFLLILFALNSAWGLLCILLYLHNKNNGESIFSACHFYSIELGRYLFIIRIACYLMCM